MFSVKMVCKYKNTIKNTKSQPKKTVCKTMNFGSTKLTKLKKIYIYIYIYI